jgi:RNA polymerase sigma-70 factor (ECF subfamily)
MNVDAGPDGMSRADADDLDLVDVQRVLQGDTAAFAGIVERWQRRLINLAWRYCRDGALAEDMAQDAFLKAFRSLGAFRGDAKFSTWLTAVAINSYRTWIRDRPPSSMALDRAVLDESAGDSGHTLDARRRDALVRRMVTMLPLRYREPMVLYYLNEMDLAETARTLRLPEGTVKARLHRARVLLKRRLEAVLADVAFLVR